FVKLDQLPIPLADGAPRLRVARITGEVPEEVGAFQAFPVANREKASAIDDLLGGWRNSREFKKGGEEVDA
ncbi:MAG: hypothetical protein EBT75_09925, partial [Proteobacteria bacterium]|nr:hypothetical protein [Pseudomonadota bacterium]